MFLLICHFVFYSLEHEILVKMVKALRSFTDHLPLTTEELSLITNGSKQNRSHILSSLTSLLRLMSVQCLDLTQCKSEAMSLTALLGLQDPLILRSVFTSVASLMFYFYIKLFYELIKLCFISVCSGFLKRLFSSLF